MAFFQLITQSYFKVVSEFGSPGVRAMKVHIQTHRTTQSCIFGRVDTVGVSTGIQLLWVLD